MMGGGVESRHAKGNRVTARYAISLPRASAPSGDAREKNVLWPTWIVGVAPDPPIK